MTPDQENKSVFQQHVEALRPNLTTSEAVRGSCNCTNASPNGDWQVQRTSEVRGGKDQGMTAISVPSGVPLIGLHYRVTNNQGQEVASGFAIRRDFAVATNPGDVVHLFNMANQVIARVSN